MRGDLPCLCEGCQGTVSDPLLHREARFGGKAKLSSRATATEGDVMKQLILTGLAQETDFENPEQSTFFLVFNGGELRVPISEEAAQVVIQHRFGANGSNGHAAEEIGETVYQPPQSARDPNDVYDEDGEQV